MSELAKMRAVAAAEFDKKFPPPSLELPGDEYDALEEQRKVEFVAWWSAWQHMAALASPADALVAVDRVDAVKCWKDRMASPQNREWRGAMEEAMEAEIMELRMVLSSNKVDAERYRYIRDTATLDNAVWEALEGYGMTNGAGELLEDEYRAGMDRAIDRAIQAQKDGHG